MTVADYSRQALLRQCCCIEVRESSSGKNAFFPTMCLLHLHLGFRVASGFILFGRLTHLRMPYAVSVRQVSGLPPASFRSRLAADTLALGYVLGATPCTRDFHPLERAHAERTNKSPVFRRGIVYKTLPEVAEFDFCFWLLAVLSSANRQIFLRTEFKAKSRFETFAQLAQKKT
ncbi:hypothetical protein [Duodenibacillus massiliensis]|uniref:hypothetical protein n=1 Tax=Duodenibacillus massiliensis TaxID=1852381 RepID=UPI001160FD84|nr:hypothetical protein [Duodenibacillus massiliensis]